jgi:hypothetical protein
MVDDPNKRHQDGWTVSFIQTYEYTYFRDTIEKEFPDRSDEVINDAILACRKAIAPSEGRAKLTECVKKKLGG